MNIRYPIYEGVYRILTMNICAGKTTGSIIIEELKRQSDGVPSFPSCRTWQEAG